MSAGHAMTGPERAALQRRVIEAAAQELLRVGPDKFRVVTIADCFANEVPRASVYRWVGAARASGRLGAGVAAEVRRRVVRRTKKRIKKVDAAAEIAEVLPPPLKPEDLVPTRGGSITDHLRECVSIAHQVMDHAKQIDGKPRNPKMLLAASEHLRRCVETIQRLHEGIYAVQRIEEFNRQVIVEVRKESPMCAERILAALERLCREYGAVDPGAIDHRAAA